MRAGVVGRAKAGPGSGSCKGAEARRHEVSAALIRGDFGGDSMFLLGRARSAAGLVPEKQRRCGLSHPAVPGAGVSPARIAQECGLTDAGGACEGR